VQPLHLSCKQPTNRSAEHTLNVTETSITIKDLLSYSIYNFTVFAENTKLKGHPLQFFAGTLPEVTVFPRMRGVNIRLSDQCNSIRVLVKTVVMICTNEWCRNHNKAPKRMNFYDNDRITINGLTPFSDYIADLTFHDFFTYDTGEHTMRKNFRTKPTSN
jgi:hypothetical protein